MAKAGINRAFETLRDFEKRALIHAVGLPEQAAAQGTWSGIAFRLAGANLVSEISEIVEIMTVPPFTTVPGSQTWMLGVSNVRGNLVPIVDLRGFLAGERTAPDKHTRVLVVPQHGGNVGLLIDEIVGQRHFLDEELTDEQHYAEHMVSRYVGREYRKGDEYWGTFTVERLTSEPSFQQAAA